MASFQAGDKVKFLNNVGGGVITRVIDDRMVEVTTPDGFEMPILSDELLLIEEAVEARNFAAKSQRAEVFEPSEKIVPQQKALPAPKPKAREKKLVRTAGTHKVFLALLPFDPTMPTASDLELFLINQTDNNLIYNVLIPEKGLYRSINGIADAWTIEPVEKLQRSKLVDFDHLVLQCLSFRDVAHAVINPMQAEWQIRKGKLFKESSYTDSDFFYPKAIVHEMQEFDPMAKAVEQLSQTGIGNIIQSKEPTVGPLPKRNQPPEEIIVDLHIHQLVEDERGLEAKDKLEIQTQRFHQAMADALTQKAKRVVVIHGVGNGRLKTEIRRLLDRQYTKYKYQDASFAEYGFGATLVWIR